MTLSNLEKYEEAVVSYDKALQLQPNDEFAWNLRGNILSDLERYEEAIVSYDKALTLQPDFYIVWDNRGLI